MAGSKGRKKFPRPIGQVHEDGSYRTVGGWTRDAETKKLRKPIRPRKKK